MTVVVLDAGSDASQSNQTVLFAPSSSNPPQALLL
jgi:hypothetical protein